MAYCAYRRPPDKYPALLSVPGAGVRPYRGLAEIAGRGVVTLPVGIHGIPVTMEQSVYDSPGAGALANYNTYGLDNKDRYYFRRVYLGCVRADDFLTSHPKWDSTNLAVTGGSQGGALSIVTARWIRGRKAWRRIIRRLPMSPDTCRIALVDGRTCSAPRRVRVRIARLARLRRQAIMMW